VRGEKSRVNLSDEDIDAVVTAPRGRLSICALAHILVMAALCNRGAIIFLPCSFVVDLGLGRPQ